MSILQNPTQQFIAHQSSLISHLLPACAKIHDMIEKKKQCFVKRKCREIYACTLSDERNLKEAWIGRY